MGFVQMSTTAGSIEEAQRIADRLVEQRLAACVQVTGPISSTYRWNGEVQRSEESMCIIKTRRDLVEAVEESIRSLHSYENPEIIVTSIEGGSADYLAWIASETAGSLD